jgi:hypothetical protein
MPQVTSSARYRTAVSAAVVLAVALHAGPVLHRPTMKRQWPFMVWAMYKDSRPPGPISANQRHIMGTTAAGERAEITEPMLGLAGAAIMRLYGKAMWAGDSATAARFFELVNRTRTDPFVEVRMEGENFLLTDSGLVERKIPTVTFHAAPPAAR